jgi:hypothetical protein
VSVQPEQAWLVRVLKDDWQEMRTVAMEYGYVLFASESAFRLPEEVLPKFYGVYFVKHTPNSIYHIAEIGPGFDENVRPKVPSICFHGSLLHKLWWRNRPTSPQPLLEFLTLPEFVNALIK